MIGVINSKLYFEFTGEEGFLKAMTKYGADNDCETIIIVDTSDRVRAIIYNNEFEWGADIRPDEKYFIYGDAGTTYRSLNFKDSLPNKKDWQLGFIPFAFCSRKNNPGEINLY